VEKNPILKFGKMVGNTKNARELVGDMAREIKQYTRGMPRLLIT
jgi:hypothetical protein